MGDRGMKQKVLFRADWNRILCVPGHSRMGDAGWVQDSIFLFMMIINISRKWGEFKIFLRDPRDREILLRSFASCKKERMYFGSGLWKCVQIVSPRSLQSQAVLRWNIVTLEFEVGASSEKSCLWWSVNIVYGGLTCTGEGWNWEIIYYLYGNL